MVGRVSYTFGFQASSHSLVVYLEMPLPVPSLHPLPRPAALPQGPCVSTDTACSSSLVAAHLSHTSLANHECSAASVGGVNALLSSKTSIRIAALQALRWAFAAVDPFL